MYAKSKQDFQASETVLYDTTVVAACHYTFVKTHNMYNAERDTSNPVINYGLWVTMLCQYGFIDCNKCTILMRMLIVGEFVGILDRGYLGTLYFLLNFTLTLKLLLKK